jgi:hypothetical protein
MSTCRACGKPIIFAVVSNQAGRPPSRMPLDPRPDPAGNVACYRDVSATLVGHVLTKGEKPPGYQRLYMPHFATCEKRQPAAQLPEGVTGIAAWKAARTAHAKGRRNRRGSRPAPQITGVRIPPPAAPERDP